MSKRQSILKSIYPVLTSVTRLFGINNAMEIQKEPIQPHASVFQIPFELNNSDTVSLEQWKGKMILIVNTASDCGYTAQYEELQQLYVKYKDRLVVIAFPANDFKKQEKGNNKEIARFCTQNYGVEFPIAAKTSVIKGSNQHPLYTWLSEATLNGWNNKAPSWNFSKYLLNSHGQLLGYFESGVSPLHKNITELLTTSTQ